MVIVPRAISSGKAAVIGPTQAKRPYTPSPQGDRPPFGGHARQLAAEQRQWRGRRFGGGLGRGRGASRIGDSRLLKIPY